MPFGWVRPVPVPRALTIAPEEDDKMERDTHTKKWGEVKGKMPRRGERGRKKIHEMKELGKS